MSAETFANYFTVFAITQWVLISLGYTYDSMRVLLRTRQGYQIAKHLGNGRRFIMHNRYQKARVHLTLALIGLAVGISSALRWINNPAPSVDIQIASMVRTEGVVAVLALAWMLKRLDLAAYHEVDRRK